MHVRAVKLVGSPLLVTVYHTTASYPVNRTSISCPESVHFHTIPHRYVITKHPFVYYPKLKVPSRYQP